MLAHFLRHNPCQLRRLSATEYYRSYDRCGAENLNENVWVTRGVPWFYSFLCDGPSTLEIGEEVNKLG